ncbi:hypothetical protein ACGF12_37590 [Kitasatospora sp. NPDC048296]|uniref:hypothetical protein n=1 Tax=Kitasatospora sp. NPDC048296 TaxID=3364048 RepID=UPI003721C7CB
MTLALLALMVGCSTAPAESGRTPAAHTPAAHAPSAVPPVATTAWRSLLPLSGRQLTGVLLPVAELPAGSTTEADSGLSGRGVKAMADLAQRYPACAPVLTVMSDQMVGSTRLWYVTGSNTFANRTLVDVGGIPGGRSHERFDKLKDAVYGGGCTGFRPDKPYGGDQLQVEPVSSDALEAPAVGFRILLPTGAMTSQGGLTWVFLYVAVGENRVLFFMADDTAHAPALRTDLVTAQIHRLVTAVPSPDTPTT